MHRTVSADFCGPKIVVLKRRLTLQRPYCVRRSPAVCAIMAACGFLKGWNYIYLLLDLYNREIVGHACGERKDADLVKASFATIAFPLFEIEVFHTDRGPEFDNMAVDEMLEVFGITRSLSRKGNPYDNAAIESMNKTLKTASIYRRSYSSIDELRHEVNSYVQWYNNERMHSTLGYMSPVEFREAGLSL